MNEYDGVQVRIDANHRLCQVDPNGWRLCVRFSTTSRATTWTR